MDRAERLGLFSMEHRRMKDIKIKKDIDIGLVHRSILPVEGLRMEANHCHVQKGAKWYWRHQDCRC